MRKSWLGALVLGLAVFAVAPAFAADDMKLGLGFFRPEAPVGGRAWISETMAVDLGIGIQAREYSAGGEEETKIGFNLDAGLPIVLVDGGDTKFFIRPGLAFASDPVYDSGEGDWTSATEIWFSGDFGVEYFFSDMFSIQGAHGIVFKSIDPGIEGSDTTTQFGTEGFGISRVGFHVYFKGLD
ncbi:MAG: hypothetical protein GF328_13820 [Candidatus Latescibacteria bacterium]|nr:hypothetical protein [Candidatus Latescibacterota bacterium]